MHTTTQAASLLFKSYRDRKRISGLPEVCRPLDETAAYQCQNEFSDYLLENQGGTRIGYKIACTNKSAQERVNIREPFYGPLLSPLVYKSPARLKTDHFFMRVIEPEFGFQMAYDLPSRDKEYTNEEVKEAVSAIFPGIEIVDSRYLEWKSMDAPSLIADNACNGGFVYGKPHKDWKALDLANLNVNLIVNDVSLRKGRGNEVMGNPLNALVWLVNKLSRQGRYLKAGDFVTTGTASDVYPAEFGDRIVADFGVIGSCELEFT